jgi:carboxyvinyl-carboxyphosphonate phosphorylmutase
LLPPRFGQKQGEELISVPEFAGKLKAAVAARQEPTLVVIGRIAALRSEGLQGAITRAKVCVDAGVDGIFLTGAQTRDEIEAIHKEISLPLLLGSTPPTIGDRAFLGAHGVRIALQGHVPFAVMVKALYDTYKHLKAGGLPAALKDQAASEELMHLALNRDAYRRWQRDYLGQP